MTGRRHTCAYICRASLVVPLAQAEILQIDANMAERLDMPSIFAGMFEKITKTAPLDSIIEDIENKLAPVMLGLARQNRWVFLKQYYESFGEQMSLAIKQV